MGAQLKHNAKQSDLAAESKRGAAARSQAVHPEVGCDFSLSSRSGRRGVGRGGTLAATELSPYPNPLPVGRGEGEADDFANNLGMHHSQVTLGGDAGRARAVTRLPKG